MEAYPTKLQVALGMFQGALILRPVGYMRTSFYAYSRNKWPPQLQAAQVLCSSTLCSLTLASISLSLNHT
jgi:hypothetical protein